MPACFCPNSPTAVIKVRGEDALPFLQGQFTQELRGSEPRLCAYGLWLNQKGKVVADSFALREDSGWRLVSFFSPASAIIERLEAYIIADDVELRDETAEWTGWTLLGDEMQLRGAGVIAENVGVGQWYAQEAARVFAARYGAQSIAWIQRRADVEPAWLRAGPEKLISISPEELERVRIERGVPRIGVDVGLNDLPNEAGLNRDAISYTKGCYLGQEIMARLKTQGQVRRALHRVRARGDGSVPNCPVDLFVGEKKAGELRSVARAGVDSFVGLAMLSKLAVGEKKFLGLAPHGVEVEIVEALT